MNKISFCIITNGKRPKELNLCVKSIHENFINSGDYEILIVGDNIPCMATDKVKIIEDHKFQKFLGARKNIATENSSGDILVHCDDDIIFPETVQEGIFRGNLNTSWQVLDNLNLAVDMTLVSGRSNMRTDTDISITNNIK